MKPSRKERHQIYKDVLKDVKKNGWRAGFCLHIGNVCTYHTYNGGLMENFPEIYKRRPHKCLLSEHWFPVQFLSGVDEKRENILKLAIKETAPKKKNL